MTSRLAKLRDAAAVRQDWCCWYCGVRMLPASPAPKRADRLLMCTAEHLVARSAGGATSVRNIVAACWYCNSGRHKRPVPLDPAAYKAHVERRMRKGRWHGRGRAV